MSKRTVNPRNAAGYVPASPASVAAYQKRQRQRFALRWQGHAATPPWELYGWESLADYLCLKESTIKQYLKGLGGHPLHIKRENPKGEEDYLIVSIVKEEQRPPEPKKMGRRRTDVKWAADWDGSEHYGGAPTHERKKT